MKGWRTRRANERKKQTRVELLEKALRFLVYEDGGRWYTGIKGDSDVTDEIGAALSR